MSAADEIRQASEQYYTALSRLLSGDVQPLKEAWSHSSDVTAMNPYGGIEIGWERLEAVFEQVAHMCQGSQATVGLENPLRRISSDLAYEIGIECGEGIIMGKPASIRHRVTNIYRREADGWKMVHRHTDLNPAEQKEVGHLQSS
ncbi:MAG: nuclear transport factor 2 family protein [Chloroflexi bacterium]|nr:MAG: nuclear transport factor 2 family protein [Chloroflexota bacterium]